MRNAVAFFLLAATGAAAAPLTNVPERPKAEPVQDERYGIRSEDPYRWMEDKARAADMTAWVRKASDHAITQLRALPERAAFAASLEQATRTGVRYGSLRAVGGRLFYRRIDPADRVHKLVVREGGKERILFDPAAGTSEVTAISNYVISPDGKTVAIHVAKGGAEVGETRFLDIATGKQQGGPLGPIWGEDEVAWLTPGRIVYTRLSEPPPGGDPLENNRVAVVEPGAAGPGTFVLGAGVDGAPPFEAAEVPVVATSPLSRWVLGLASNARADRRIFVAAATDLAAGRTSWHEVAGYPDQAAAPVLRGNSLYLLSTKQNPNGTIMRYEVSPAGVSRPREVFAAKDLVLTELVATADGLYAAGHREGVGRLLFLPGGKGPGREVKLPFESSVYDLSADAEARTVTFALSGWFKNGAYFRAAVGRASPLGIESATWPKSQAFSAVREQAVSADGTRVPMVVLLPEGGKREGGRPTILEAYASYGYLTLGPGYNTYEQPWLARGGAMALCGARGGGERGRSWHEAGRSANKPNAHADYIACAERLIAAGYAEPGQIVATGTSAGGLLAPAAALKRPDLFTALIPRVAVLNATRLEASINGTNQYAEMGDPRTEAGYKALLGQDAFLMLATASDAPDMLITVGLNDMRVAPWMAAKFAARALDRFGNRRAILIRADAEGGHGIGSARDQLIAEWADAYAFAWSQAQGE